MLLRSTDPSRQAIDPGSLDQKPVLALVLIAVRAVTHDIALDEVQPEPAEKPSYFERCLEHGSRGSFAVVTGAPLAFVTGTREKAGATPCV
jgi:hypothetical protein